MPEKKLYVKTSFVLIPEHRGYRTTKFAIVSVNGDNFPIGTPINTICDAAREKVIKNYQNCRAEVVFIDTVYLGEHVVFIDD